MICSLKKRMAGRIITVVIDVVLLLLEKEKLITSPLLFYLLYSGVFISVMFSLWPIRIKSLVSKKKCKHVNVVTIILFVVSTALFFCFWLENISGMNSLKARNSLLDSFQDCYPQYKYGIEELRMYVWAEWNILFVWIEVSEQINLNEIVNYIITEKEKLGIKEEIELIIVDRGISREIINVAGTRLYGFPCPGKELRSLPPLLKIKI